MSVTCPCCRAVNEATSCRRCKADLSLVLAYAEQLRVEAVEAALRGQYEKAFELYQAASGG